MITERKQDLYNALQRDSKILQTKFSQISAEAIYYAFLNKQVKKDNKSKPNNTINNRNSNELKSGKENTRDCKPNGITNNQNVKQSQKPCKENKVNKNKQLYYSLANEYSFMKSKNDCEFKEGFYKVVTLRSMNKRNKTNVNNATKQKQKVKNQTNKPTVNDSKAVKTKVNNNISKTILRRDCNTKLGKSGGEQNQVIQALKKEHCFMNWKKNAENGELVFQEHCAKKKKDIKKEPVTPNTKQKNVDKQNKKVSPKLQFVIQKSLSNDYKDCLKPKKNHEDEEMFYQRHLSQSVSKISLSTPKSKGAHKSGAEKKM